jgi:hypothetical protein
MYAAREASIFSVAMVLLLLFKGDSDGFLGTDSTFNSSHHIFYLFPGISSSVLTTLD